MSYWIPKTQKNALLLYSGLILMLVWAICQTEVDAKQGPSPEKILKRMDSNKDGKVTEKEWMGPPQAFRKIDTNSDNHLTYDELERWFSKPRGGQQAGASSDESSSALSTQARTNSKKSRVAWVDTHIHLRRGTGTLKGAAQHAIKLMDEYNIQTAIVMPPPFPKTGRSRNRYDVKELSKLAKAYQGRFLFLGGGHLINGIIESTPAGQVTDKIKEDFKRKANSILDAGAGGFGEMGIMHLSHFPGHPSYWVRPDHPLFLMLADIAGSRNAVIDIHMDVVEKTAPTPSDLRGSNPSNMEANLELFERLVAHNRNARVMLAHAGWDVTGQWSAALSHRLLSDHPNLYMSLKISPKGSQNENKLLPGGYSKPVSVKWLSVIKEFPDRFVIGSDSFFAEVGARGKAPGGMTQFNGSYIAAFLEKLPGDLATQIGRENAISIYGKP